MSLLVNTLFAVVKMIYTEREERKYRQKEGKKSVKKEKMGRRAFK